MARIPANSKESPLESEATARPPLYVRVARFAQPGTAEGIMIVRPPPGSVWLAVIRTSRLGGGETARTERSW
jgi:hypothetical protein